jgi:hypothetical protein
MDACLRFLHTFIILACDPRQNDLNVPHAAARILGELLALCFIDGYKRPEASQKS